MNETLKASLLLVFGVAVGMLIEHQRFLSEIQGLSKKHATSNADTAVAQPPPGAA
jgi:hypothetical protein